MTLDDRLTGALGTVLADLAPEPPRRLPGAAAPRRGRGALVGGGAALAVAGVAAGAAYLASGGTSHPAPAGSSGSTLATQTPVCSPSQVRLRVRQSTDRVSAYALAHTFQASDSYVVEGDLVPDPGVTCRLYDESGTGLTFVSSTGAVVPFSGGACVYGARPRLDRTGPPPPPYADDPAACPASSAPAPGSPPRHVQPDYGVLLSPDGRPLEGTGDAATTAEALAVAAHAGTAGTPEPRFSAYQVAYGDGPQLTPGVWHAHVSYGAWQADGPSLTVTAR